MVAYRRNWHWRIIALLVVVVVTLGQLGSAEARGPESSGILPPTPRASSVAMAQWWKWVIEAPRGQSPILAETLCAPSGVGHIWYLVGSFSSDPTQFSCTIPADTLLFFPIITSAYFQFPTDSREAWVAGKNGIDSFVDSIDVTSLQLKIDGESVGSLANYRVEPRAFIYGRLPENNVFGLPASTIERGYAGGYFVTVRPLPPGEHSIHFEAQAEGFSQDVTYNITVAAP